MYPRSGARPTVGRCGNVPRRLARLMSSTSRADRKFTSTVAKELAVGVTGIVLIVFILGHLVGNLLLLAGPSVFNAYAARLQADGVSEEGRQQRMAAANPCIIPRNYLLQEAIDAAAAGDLTLLEHLLVAIRTPYTAYPEHRRFSAKRPEWARNAPGCSALSCSS